ncbi:MAG TPA: hypothetical protein VLX30_14705 [Burkholderiales bacterium]|nr:hypothetical protein [Burkholderiales bacterium]
MDATVFTQVRFWLLVLFSIVLPFLIYRILFKKRSISRNVVLLFGLTLVVIAGVDVYLLQSLASSARLTPSLVDDVLFASEISTALYLLPAMIGGVGINVISHVLSSRLREAERAFEAEQAPRSRRS